jgi:hypothetical protein
MFQLDQQNCKMISATTRIEFHGEDRVPASDVKLHVDVPAEALNGLSKGLCESLYRKPGKGDQIALIDKAADNAYTMLRHPCLEPQKLKQKFPGYELALGVVEGDAFVQKAFFADAEAKNFTVTPHEGGSTAIEFTVSVSDVDEDDYLELRRLLIDGAAVVTLTPPTAQKKQEDQVPKAA